MNTEITKRAEGVHTEELGSTGEVTVVIIHEAAPDQPTTIAAEVLKPEAAAALATDPTTALAEEELPTPDLIGYLENLADTEGQHSLDALNLPTISIARPTKAPAALHLPGSEAQTAAAKYELRIQ